MDDHLNLSRLDEADVQLEREDFDLSAVARDVAARLKPAAKKNGVVITTYGDKAMVNGVKSIVDEMVYNLCDNAVKYNKHNGRVTLNVENLPEGVTLTVTDGHRHPRGGCGPGIRALSPGGQSHSKEIGGTGLGAPLSSMGAAFHNAKVSLQSTEGEGTTVRLVFPQLITSSSLKILSPEKGRASRLGGPSLCRFACQFRNRRRMDALLCRKHDDALILQNCWGGL